MLTVTVDCDWSGNSSTWSPLSSLYSVMPSTERTFTAFGGAFAGGALAAGAAAAGATTATSASRMRAFMAQGVAPLEFEIDAGEPRMVSDGELLRIPETV